MHKKNIIIAVTGGIACYKSVALVSILKKANYDIQVVMTENATKFIAPFTFQSISHKPVIVDMFEKPTTWDIQHISLAQKTNLIVVAPATANIIGKVAHGIADDMLSTTIMATTAPVLFVPAMNFVMYENKIVQSNLKKLVKLGFFIMEPDEGVMACGAIGKGRMPGNNTIMKKILSILK